MKNEKTKAQGAAPAEMSEREARIRKMIDDFKAEAEALGVTAVAFVNDRESRKTSGSIHKLRRFDILLMLNQILPTVEDAEVLLDTAELILQKRRDNAAKAAEPAEA